VPDTTEVAVADGSAWILLESFGVSSRELDGRTALITGAGRGIGEQLARLLARLGANVVIADILPTAQQVADSIVATGGSATFVQCDLENAAEAERLADEAVRVYGRVDILVNGAMQLVMAPVVATTLEDWDRTFNVNLRAAFLLIRKLLPGMTAQERGVIVNMISYEGGPLQSAYYATKVGLRSLALSVAREVGDKSGIASFSFVPGIVDTPAVREVVMPGISAALGIPLDELETTVLAVNPGYPGLLPVEHCAAALAFTIVHAREYHGQVVDPFEPLSRFGVIDIPPFDATPWVAPSEMTAATLPQHVHGFLSEVIQHNRVLEERIAIRTRELAEANQQSEALLLNVLPKPIANRLKRGEATIADQFDEVTVLFADIANFTPMAAQLAPEQVVEILDAVFSALDDVADAHGLEKIKTIGDCYMMVGGLPEPREDHAPAVARAALDLGGTIAAVSESTSTPLSARVGMHTGSVVAGVIGRRKFIYDLWGDTVNTASRMESHGVPGQIQCTEAVYNCLHDRYRFEPRGVIDVKGKGPMSTYFLLGART
jgi:NAD(P)-dependent dehydrogenase (short-subunit alcohol dehydrogenase family)/class 3 adenylate cyclase